MLSPLQGMLQSDWGLATGEFSVFPHQHSEPYSVPPYLKPDLVQRARHDAGVLDELDATLVERIRVVSLKHPI